MCEQYSMLGIFSDEEKEELKRQTDMFLNYAKKKRNWENAFQKWSNEHGIENYGNIEDYGCCGFGSMCDWCKDNDYGRPCVRALNAMCREKGISIDYSERDFEKIWNM